MPLLAEAVTLNISSGTNPASKAFAILF